jgi:hypothetical protein
MRWQFLAKESDMIVLVLVLWSSRDFSSRSDSWLRACPHHIEADPTSRHGENDPAKLNLTKKPRYCEKGLSSPQHIVYCGRKLSMNKHYRLPLRTRPKNVSTAVRWRRGSPCLVTTGLIALGGLAALFAIGFATFFVYTHFSHKAEPVAVAAPSVSATPSPASTPVVAATDVLRPLADPNRLASPVPSPTVAPRPQGLSTPSLPAVAAPASSGLAVQGGQKSDTPAENATKTSAKAARKSLEKKRQAAERKRARLEQMYQNHEISTAEYNKGEQEYKDEIQKYRKQVSPGPQ